MLRRLVLLFIVLVMSAANVYAAKDVSRPSSTDDGSGRLRILHFSISNITYENAIKLVDKAHEAGFNTFQVLIMDGVSLDHAPWKPQRNAWSKDLFSKWVGYVRGKDIDLVPEVKLLSHQEKFLQDVRPDLMFNAVTYDPRNGEIYKIVYPLLDEIIQIVHPRAIHIGHDEVMGWNKTFAKKMLKPGDSVLPADLFLSDVVTIHAYLRSRGIDTWMWGDMLISPQEFPGMQANQLHGTMPGYGVDMRRRLPKDIVICDWHYFDRQIDFPSMAAMQNEGFRVIGATWKQEDTIRNFTRYSKSQKAYGMMATTWYYVQKNSVAMLDWIVRSSGQLFADPDAIISQKPADSDSLESAPKQSKPVGESDFMHNYMPRVIGNIGH